MLQDLKQLCGNKLAAVDGALGVVQAFYFDDQTWVVRYLVADTDHELRGRLILLTPTFAPAPKMLSSWRGVPRSRAP
jgi:hypothetical protein